MFKESKGNSTTAIAKDRRKKSTASSNLYVSPSFIGKFRKLARRKQKSQFSRNATNDAENDSGPIELPKDARLASNVPKDAAVHFGNFYDVQGGSDKPQPDKTKSSLNSASSPLRTVPRLEFTRQMVHKLERTAGTEEYARQVSALLEETVEPPHFKLRSVPAENSIPDGRQNPSGYPLWYKEPYKMPFARDDIYELLEKYNVDNPSRSGKDIFDEESSGNDSCEEASDDEQIVKDESSRDLNADRTEKKEDSVLASGSTTVTEPDDTDSKENGDASDDRSEKTSSPA